MLRSSLVLSCLVGLSIVPLGAPVMAALLGGCSNHDALAPDPDAGTSAHSSSRASSSSSGAGGEGGALPIEPDGPTRLTLVDGVVDAPAVAFCFVAYPGGTGAKPPFPSGGLAFGHALVVPLPSDEVPMSDAELTLVTGDLGSLGATTCDALLTDPAGHPAVTLTSLGVLPASTLTAKRSLLLTPMGCLGGATHVDTNQEAICGKGYTPQTPTITLSAAPLSRLADPAHLAFQAVNATTALKKADFYLRPSFDGSPDHPVVVGLPSGAAGPFPPYTQLGAADLGSVGGSDVGIASDPSSSPQVRKKLVDAFAAAGLASIDVLNGKGFALVAVGASPSVGMGSWWNDLAFVAVSADPGGP